MTEPKPKERIIQAMIDLVYARSYATVGVNEICALADVKKGSFYHFFPSKVDLALEALEKQWTMYRMCMLDPIFGTGNFSKLSRFQNYLDEVYLYHQNIKAEGGIVKGCPFGNLAQESSTLDETLQKRLARIFEEWTDCFRRALEEDSCEEPTIVEPALAAEAFLAQLEGVLLLAKTHNDPERIKRLIPNMLSSLFGSISTE